jgi:hypothetical protein
LRRDIQSAAVVTDLPRPPHHLRMPIHRREAHPHLFGGPLPPLTVRSSFARFLAHGVIPIFFNLHTWCATALGVMFISRAICWYD